MASAFARMRHSLADLFTRDFETFATDCVERDKSTAGQENASMKKVGCVQLWMLRFKTSTNVLFFAMVCSMDSVKQ